MNGQFNKRFLRHWLTPSSVKPWRKKVDAILHLRPPTNVKQLHSFLGMVNNYHDMWPCHTHALAPLTALTGKCSFIWTTKCQQAFDQMKALVSSDALLTFPDHMQPLNVETDASDYQLSSVIKQHGCPVANYSHKLNSAQHNYMTIEKELVSIVETFKEFHTILLGSIIRVHMDHKNLINQLTDFTTQRVLHWHLLLEEFNPTVFYKDRPNNVLANAILRVPMARTERESTTTSAQLIDFLSCYPFQVEFPSDPVAMANCWAAWSPNHVASQEAIKWFSPGRYPLPMIVVHHQQETLFLEHPVFDAQGRLSFPYKTLYEYQQEDPGILELPTNQPTNHTNINWKIWVVIDLFVITKDNTIISV